MLRSLFRFSIRELFLLSVMVAVLIAWWLDSENKRRALEDYRRTVELTNELKFYLSKTQGELDKARWTIERLESETDTLMLRIGALRHAGQ